MGKPANDGSALVVNEQFIEIISKILQAFSGDIKKARFWLTTSNPHFGLTVPLKLIVTGKGNKVLEFIDDALECKEVPREWTLQDQGKYYDVKKGCPIPPTEEGSSPDVRVREIIVDSLPVILK